MMPNLPNNYMSFEEFLNLLNNRNNINQYGQFGNMNPNNFFKQFYLYWFIDNIFPFINPNPMINIFPEPGNVKREEDLEVKRDIERLIHSNNEIEIKNKDIQTIINYIPYTVIQENYNKLKERPKCVICLSDFKV